MTGYAPSMPYVFTLAGGTNNLSYNPASDLFTLHVTPGNAGTATVGFSLAPIPSLQIVPVGNGQFQISWPAAAVGYDLEKATNLTPPVVWSPTSETVNTINGQNVVTIINGDSTAFYRLRQ